MTNRTDDLTLMQDTTEIVNLFMQLDKAMQEDILKLLKHEMSKDEFCKLHNLDPATVGDF